MRSLERIGNVAGKEFALEKNLAKMKSEWVEIEFSLAAYRDSVIFSSVMKAMLCICFDVIVMLL